MIHGAGINLPTKLDHLLGIYVGKYTSTMEHMGMGMAQNDQPPIAGWFFLY